MLTLLSHDILSEPAVQNCQSNSSESGDTLNDVIRNIRHQPYEIVAVFDAYGHKICEHTNRQEEYTAFAIPHYWESAINLMVHNHIVDGTFSPMDLLTLTSINVRINMVVSPSCNFYLFRPTKGWPDLEEVTSEYETIIDILLHSPRHNYDMEAARHLALRKVTQHYGMQYRIEAVDGATMPAIFASNA